MRFVVGEVRKAMSANWYSLIGKWNIEMVTFPQFDDGWLLLIGIFSRRNYAIAQNDKKISHPFQRNSRQTGGQHCSDKEYLVIHWALRAYRIKTEFFVEKFSVKFINLAFTLPE